LDIRIRRYEPDDVLDVFEGVRESLADLGPWMPWSHPGYSLEETRAWLAMQVPAFDAGTEYQFAIVSADGRYFGGCGLNRIDVPNRRANLGYWVRSGVSRRGVATAAVHLLHEWALANTDLVRLEIVVAAGNIASHRVAEKSGAAREGVLRNRLILHGIVGDATMFSLVRDEAARKAPSV
jgi:ribosomal-protein-serine acetyltransferase